MQLSDLSVRRPVFAAVLAILISIVGIVAFLGLPVREIPDTDPPVVSVSTTYTGAAASVIESRITQPIEEQLSGIEGIETISSRSRDGASEISIEFTPGRDVDAAANDVRDRIGGVVRDLPEEALAPEVRKVDADASPIMFIVFSRPGWSPLQLSDYLDRNVIDRFSTIDGVARVIIGGEARLSMRVWLDAGRLAAYRLTPLDVENALRNQNVELPAGRLESAQQNLTLRVNRAFRTPTDFRALVIGRGGDGYLVRLGDVARIEEAAENPYTAFRFNGRTGIGMGIVRQSGANTLAVAQAAKRLAMEMRKDLPPGVQIFVGSDTSVFIEEAIKGVWRTLVEAAIVVVAVIFLFLGTWRATLIPAITVPICLLGTFAVLWLCGFSINLLTLLALVLAIGLVVDDAIVVLENIHHHIQDGADPLVAAFVGTRQVGFAVVSTTLVVCAVFVPVMFIAGQTGLLFRELAVAMIAAVALSGVIALSLAPMLCSKLLRRDDDGRLSAAVDRGFARIEAGYVRALDRALRRPTLVIGGTLVLLLVAGLLFARLDSELMPAEDTGLIDIRLTAPEGTGFNQLDRYTSQAEALVLPTIGHGPVRGMVARLPATTTPTEDFVSANLNVFLRPWAERTATSLDMTRQLNARMAELPGVRGNATVRNSLSRGRGQPVNFVIAGASYPELARARDRILAAARDNPGLVNPDADYVESKPQILIDVDSKRAGDLGVSVDDVSQALQTLMGSRRVSTFADNGKEYRVVVQAEANGRDRVATLAGVYVRSRTGVLVPLSNLVRLSDGSTARDLGRFNKIRAITLQSGLAPGYPLGRALAFFEAEAARSPEVLAVGYRGDSQSLRQTGDSIWIVFGLTIVIIYLLLAAQFESFVHPAVIIATVPLAVAGGVLGLATTGATLNLYSQIGIVMLVGLAAKNGILIVEFANQLRDEGQAMDTAIRHAAARRLRPILMTSTATVLGALPLAIGHGAGSGARGAIGVVIVSGVSIATLTTLFVIPLLYSRAAKRTTSPRSVGRRLDALIGSDAPRQASIE